MAPEVVDGCDLIRQGVIFSQVQSHLWSLQIRWSVHTEFTDRTGPGTISALLTAEINPGEKMTWTTPTVEEVCLGMEVTSYESAEILF